MSSPNESAVPALNDLIQRKRVAMLTTVGARLVSRPVTTLEIEGADTVWFMISKDSTIAVDVRSDPRVCLSYLAESDFVSLRGSASVTQDRTRIAALWYPMYSVWFEGPDDPQIALLKVVVDEVEFWDAPSTTVGRLFALAKAIATGDGTSLAGHARGAPAES